MTSLSDTFPSWRSQRHEAKPEADFNAGPNENAERSGTTTGGSEQEPVVVWEAANLMEAEIVKGRLESENIPAYIRRDAIGGIYGLTVGGLAKADVLVPAPLAEKAAALLDEEQALADESLADVEQPDEEDAIVG